MAVQHHDVRAHSASEVQECAQAVLEPFVASPCTVTHQGQAQLHNRGKHKGHTAAHLVVKQKPQPVLT